MAFLTSLQFDKYINYLKIRGYVIMELFGWHHITNNQIYNTKVIEYVQDQKISSSYMCDIIYVKTAPNIINRVDIVINWYTATSQKERITNTKEWLKQIG